MTHWDLTFNAPTPPVSTNAAKSLHWAKLERRLRPWREVAWAVARNARVQATGGFRPVPINVQVVIPFSTHRRRDAHNFTGTVVKAVVDGLVRAGVVPDDTPEWVTVLDPELIVTPTHKAIIRIRPRSTPQ